MFIGSNEQLKDSKYFKDIIQESLKEKKYYKIMEDIKEYSKECKAILNEFELINKYEILNSKGRKEKYADIK
jgi:hypothetical protein